MNTNEFRDALSYLGVEIPYGLWPGIQKDGSVVNPAANEETWIVYSWTHPYDTGRLVASEASQKPTWIQLEKAKDLLARSVPVVDFAAGLQAMDIGIAFPTETLTFNDWHHQPWNDDTRSKPTWEDVLHSSPTQHRINAIADRVQRVTAECKRRITQSAYGAMNWDEEIEDRLSGRATPEQDVERERIRTKHKALRDWIQHADRTLEALEAFDPADDIHWQAD